MWLALVFALGAFCAAFIAKSNSGFVTYGAFSFVVLFLLLFGSLKITFTEFASTSNASSFSLFVCCTLVPPTEDTEEDLPQSDNVLVVLSSSSMKRNALFFRSHRVTFLLLFLCSRRFSSLRVVIKSGLLCVVVACEMVLFGVETHHLSNPKPKTLNAFLLHLKAFSPLRKKKSLSHALSLSLLTKNERKKRFFHRRELSSPRKQY